MNYECRIGICINRFSEMQCQYVIDTSIYQFIFKFPFVAFLNNKIVFGKYSRSRLKNQIEEKITIKWNVSDKTTETVLTQTKRFECSCFQTKPKRTAFIHMKFSQNVTNRSLNQKWYRLKLMVTIFVEWTTRKVSRSLLTFHSNILHLLRKIQFILKTSVFNGMHYDTSHGEDAGSK